MNPRTITGLMFAVVIRLGSRLGALSFLTAVSMTGCALFMPPVERPVEIYTPKLTYTPPGNSTPGSAGVTVGLVQSSTTDQSLDTFRGRYNADLEKLMVARGYALRGVFPGRDALTFDDKKGIEFLVYTAIDVDEELTSLGTVAAEYNELSRAEKDRILTPINPNDPKSLKLPQGSAAFVSGKLVLTTRFEVQLIEPMSGEKLWAKTLTIQPSELIFETARAYGLKTGEQPLDRVSALLADPVVTQLSLRLLDEQYTRAFDSIWDHLDPAELRGLKADSAALKQKKAY